MRISRPQRQGLLKSAETEPLEASRHSKGMSNLIAKLPVPALLGLVLLAAIVIGLALPGPSHSKPEPRSSLETVELQAA